MVVFLLVQHWHDKPLCEVLASLGAAPEGGWPAWIDAEDKICATHTEAGGLEEWVENLSAKTAISPPTTAGPDLVVRTVKGRLIVFGCKLHSKTLRRDDYKRNVVTTNLYQCYSTQDGTVSRAFRKARRSVQALLRKPPYQINRSRSTAGLIRIVVSLPSPPAFKE